MHQSTVSLTPLQGFTLGADKTTANELETLIMFQQEIIIIDGYAFPKDTQSYMTNDIPGGYRHNDMKRNTKGQEKGQKQFW